MLVKLREKIAMNVIDLIIAVRRCPVLRPIRLLIT
jgi:hypothetical protein